MSKSKNVARVISQKSTARFAAMPGPTGVDGRGGHEVVDLANRSVVESNLKKSQAQKRAADLNEQAAAIAPVAAAHEAEVARIEVSAKEPDKTLVARLNELRGAIHALVAAGYCVGHIAERAVERVNRDIEGAALLLKESTATVAARQIADAVLAEMVGERTGAIPVEPEPAPAPPPAKSTADQADDLARLHRRTDGGKNPLAMFVAQENAMAKLYGQREFDADNLSAQDVDELLGAVEAGLSPENLTADGERSKREVAARSKLLNGARKQLLELRKVAAEIQAIADEASVEPEVEQRIVEEVGARPEPAAPAPKRTRGAKPASATPVPQAAQSDGKPVAAVPAAKPDKLPGSTRLAVVSGHEACPKRLGSQAGDRAAGKVGPDGKPAGGYWAVYVRGGTVDQAIAAGATRADILWDIRKGFVKTVEA